MRRAVYFGVVAAVCAGTAPWALGQETSALVERLKSRFALTQISADRNDIVNAGSVLVLHKDNLVMYAASNPLPPQSTYKKGKITRNSGRTFLRDLGNAMHNGEDSAIQQRIFVAGEKFWLIGIAEVNDGVIFRVCSDPYDDVRYWGELKFPFPKGSPPPAEAMLNTIAEALSVQADDNAAGNAPRPPAAPPAPAAAPAAPAAPPAPAEAPPPPIPPPPPPPPDAPPPKEISLGQTKDQVVATFGEPRKIAKVGAKEILYYPDMKVTLVNGKVTDVAVQ